jgi:hypothetical protein
MVEGEIGSKTQDVKPKREEKPKSWQESQRYKTRE